MQTAEFSIVHGIDHKPAFNCWVKQNSCQHQKAANLIYLKKSHKFGIELPKTMEQTLALDAKNGNTLWADAIFKERENVRVVFEV